MALAATLLSIEDITILTLYSILQTDMIHRAMKYLICTYLKSTLSSTNSYNYERSKIVLSLPNPMFLTREWKIIYKSPIYRVL